MSWLNDRGFTLTQVKPGLSQRLNVVIELFIGRSNEVKLLLSQKSEASQENNTAAILEMLKMIKKVMFFVENVSFSFKKDRKLLNSIFSFLESLE